ncbi:MAG: Hsp20/alpha crystallin family protein [Verrucomicrobiota bacterium]|nr:Hsp20/alpha crystallin family protein [Verrucomicrobiota bacterium]
MKLTKHHATKKASTVPVSRALTPLWPIRQLQREIDRLFEEPFGGWLAPDGPIFESWMPAVNVYEEKNNIIVKAELPGMQKEEFEVYMTGEDLNIAGERKAESEEKRAQMYRAERYFGRFHRSIPLPAAVKAEKTEAHYKDGILTIVCPKTEAAMHKPVEVKFD